MVFARVKGEGGVESYHLTGTEFWFFRMKTISGDLLYNNVNMLNTADLKMI